MRWESVGETNCSVARALSVVGERWTMLILREAFLGHRRFDEFQARTGVARNILSARLRALVGHGIFERIEKALPGDHVEYRLTGKGLDLYPILVAMLRWGDRWMACEGGPPVELVHRECGHKTHPTLVCSHCGNRVDARTTTAVVRKTAPARSRRGAKPRRTRLSHPRRSE
jgi:DNA-binding HxlR family transcriptional regulator